MKPSRRRNYGFTWNNYPEDWTRILDAFYENTNPRYLIGGVEVGDSGTPHIQGHVDLKTAMTMTALQKRFQDVEAKLSLVSLDSPQHVKNNRAYCEKDGDFHTWGTAPSQGKRNDLKAYIDAVSADPLSKKRKLMEEHSSVMARYPRFAAEYKMLCVEHVTLDWEDPPNLWVWGPPGVGKSRKYNNSDVFIKDASTKWWDGYDNEDDVLIEDVTPTSNAHLAEWLTRWADRYPFVAEVKGSTIKIRPKRIIVTSNYSLDDFSWSRREALRRRFKEIHMEK